MINCTLQDLIEFENLTKSISNNKIKVLTRFGLNQIEAIAVTAKNSEQIKISTANNSLIGSPDHLLFYEDWKKIKDFKLGDLIETKNS
jgi:hypothetical protein